MSRHRTLWLASAVLVAATALAGSPAVAQEDPEDLVIGFVPSVEAGALVEDIQPLADYLSEALGIPVEGFVSSDYTALVTAMQTGQAQIAALPPFGVEFSSSSCRRSKKRVCPLRWVIVVGS